MSISEQVISEAFIRSGGQCECHLRTCGHVGRCGKKLHWEQRGATWEIQLLDEKEPNDPLSYLMLCGDCAATWNQDGPPDRST